MMDRLDEIARNTAAEPQANIIKRAVVVWKVEAEIEREKASQLAS